MRPKHWGLQAGREKGEQRAGRRGKEPWKWGRGLQHEGRDDVPALKQPQHPWHGELPSDRERRWPGRRQGQRAQDLQMQQAPGESSAQLPAKAPCPGKRPQVICLLQCLASFVFLFMPVDGICGAHTGRRVQDSALHDASQRRLFMKKKLCSKTH